MNMMIAAKKKLLMAQKKGLDIGDVFNISTWTGNAAARSIVTGIDSSAGALAWVKATGGVQAHQLYDTERGAFVLESNSSNDGQVADGGLTLTPTGYDLTNKAQLNGSGVNFVGWEFRQAPSFFDIVTYTGDGVADRQIPHALGMPPGMIIVRRLDAGANWFIYHRTRGKDVFGNFAASSFFSNANWWGSAEPSAGVFRVYNDSAINGAGSQYVAYLFGHDESADGLIECGSYTGNGSSTGPLVAIGWQPQFLMIKRTDGATGWLMYDAVRSPANPRNGILYANTTAAQVTTPALSFNADGFQPTSNNVAYNASGGNYVYMAIREAA